MLMQIQSVLSVLLLGFLLGKDTCFIDYLLLDSQIFHRQILCPTSCRLMYCICCVTLCLFTCCACWMHCESHQLRESLIKNNGKALVLNFADALYLLSCHVVGWAGIGTPRQACPMPPRRHLKLFVIGRPPLAYMFRLISHC